MSGESLRCTPLEEGLETGTAGILVRYRVECTQGQTYEIVRTILGLGLECMSSSSLQSNLLYHICKVITSTAGL